MVLSTTTTVLAVSVLVGRLGLVLLTTVTLCSALPAGPQGYDPHMLRWGVVAVLTAQSHSYTITGLLWWGAPVLLTLTIVTLASLDTLNVLH